MGISWLPLIFGPYFALKLYRGGHGPSSAGRAVGCAVIGLVIFLLGVFLGYGPGFRFPGHQALGYALMAASAILQLGGWRSFAKALLAYAYAARIPVAIVGYFAIRGNWGTHYDAPPPGMAVPANLFAKFVAIGLLPQLIFWTAYTVIVGGLLGTIFVALRRHRPATVADRTTAGPLPR